MNNALKTGTADYNYTYARVLITGGTSGIGAACAKAFHDAGAQVTITGTRSSANDYDADLSIYRYLQLDITNNDQVDAIPDALDGLDILVNSGGVALASLGMDEYEPDVFELAVRMHLTSVYRLSKGCLDLLSASQLNAGGAIISIASMSSHFGVDVVPGYGAAKAGLVQLMKTMAVAWSNRNVRANAIAAGLIKTRQTQAITDSEDHSAHFFTRTPMKRFGEASEIADAALFLSSNHASYITGQTLNVCGGFSIAG
jgi:NAD(P)-dependent dehydrogenase (short-subunit alcohol dehydrogenase family)